MTFKRSQDRQSSSLRPVTLETGIMKYAEGSARISFGDTIVLVAASVENRVPRFLADSGQGWITAEYSMLPRATHTRSGREVSRGRPSGRTSEIQRLIGRSLRGVLDMEALGERTITVDCDVFQADGGTRTASITGAYVALVEALSKLYLGGQIDQWPLTQSLAAVSVGICESTLLLDLEYIEDSAAQVDMNVVATGTGQLIEVQSTAERGSFSRAEFDGLLDVALEGIATLTKVQEEAIAPIMRAVESRQERGARGPVKTKDEKDLWGPPA